MFRRAAPAGVDSSADRKIYLLPSSPDTRGRGICVVVDATRGPWRIARNVVRQVSNTLGGDIGCLLVLRHDAFWDNCTRAQRDSEVRSRWKTFRAVDINKTLLKNTSASLAQWLVVVCPNLNLSESQCLKRRSSPRKTQSF